MRKLFSAWTTFELDVLVPNSLLMADMLVGIFNDGYSPGIINEVHNNYYWLFLISKMYVPNLIKIIYTDNEMPEFSEQKLIKILTVIAFYSYYVYILNSFYFLEFGCGPLRFSMWSSTLWWLFSSGTSRQSAFR